MNHSSYPRSLCDFHRKDYSCLSQEIEIVLNDEENEVRIGTRSVARLKVQSVRNKVHEVNQESLSSASLDGPDCDVAENPAANGGGGYWYRCCCEEEGKEWK